MSLLNIFRGDAFSTVSLINAMENVEFLPQRLDQIGIFTPSPIRTESVAVEIRQNGSLSIIPVSPRGAPAIESTKGRRHIRSFGTHRVAKKDTILASELAFVRDFGEEQKVMELQKELARRWTGPSGLTTNVRATMEHMRLGCIQGKMIDADGTVLEDWTTAFDAPGQPATTIPTITFNFTTLNDGSLKEKLVKLTRDIARNSDGVWTAQTKIHVLCGDDFFDALAKNPEIRNDNKNRLARANQVDGYDAYGTIEYEGYVFENYRGTDDESTIAIKSDEAHAFPINTLGAFEHVMAPGESFQDLGQLGREFYPMITPDLTGHDMHVDIEVRSYPLFMCKRPKMLRKFKLA